MKKKHPLPITFFIVLMLYHFSMGFAHPVTPTLIVDRGLPSQWYGYAMSAVSVGGFMIAPFWGKLCGYISTKKIAMVGLIGYAAGQFIMMNAFSGVQLLVGRVVAGLLSAASSIALLNYIINIGDEKERPRYLTFYATSGSVMNAIGYFVGGLLGMRSIETPFYVQIAICIFDTLIAVKVLEDDTEYKHRPDHPLNVREVNPFSAFMDARRYMTPLLAVFFTAFILYHIGQATFETVFNFYIKDHFGLGSQYNGTIKAVIAATSLLANMTIAMWAVKHTNIHRTITVIYALSACAVGFSMFFYESMLPFSAMFVLYSILGIMAIPMAQNITAEHATPETSNSLMGFFQATRSFGSIIGSFAEARLYTINIHFPFISATIMIAAGTLLSVGYSMAHKKEE